MDLNPWAIALPVAGAAAAGVVSWAAVAPSSQIFGPVLSRLPCSEASVVALTFDDGPNPGVTPRLLELLQRYNASATFFVIGRYARKCLDLIREIAARGHVLGNHTETHANLVWMSPTRIARELQSCRDSVLDALGASSASSPHMRWLRPPFGFRGPQLRGAARELAPAGVVNWSRLCHDWKPQPASAVITRLARVSAGDIVLMHDGDHRGQNGDRAHVVAALEYWLPRWRDAGMEFVTIPNGVAAPR